jgi:hypothetical protein
MKDRPDAANPAKDQKDPMSDVVEEIVKNYEQALRSGLKMQQEAGQWWSKWFNQSAPTDDWQKRFAKLGNLVNESIPENQKRMEEVLDLMEKNNRKGAELLKKAANAAQTPDLADSQAKWTEFWTSSVGAVRSAADSIAQINGRAIDSWMTFLQKSSEITQVRAPKAA